jgi:hypothetical protein
LARSRAAKPPGLARLALEVDKDPTQLKRRLQEAENLLKRFSAI